jgi:hypothetical protein
MEGYLHKSAADVDEEQAVPTPWERTSMNVARKAEGLGKDLTTTADRNAMDLVNTAMPQIELVNTAADNLAPAVDTAVSHNAPLISNFLTNYLNKGTEINKQLIRSGGQVANATLEAGAEALPRIKGDTLARQLTDKVNTASAKARADISNAGNKASGAIQGWLGSIGAGTPSGAASADTQRQQSRR